MISSAENSEDTRQRILKAAEERFRIYGYNKTTMAEIAKDCDMSAANLYRYFDNKLNIGAVFAQQCMAQGTDILREVVRRPGLTAAQRLEAYVLASLRYTCNTCSDQLKINELVTIIASERKDIVHHNMKTEQSLLAEILSEGNRTGEFDIPDVLKTAQSVHSATVKFRVPIFMSLYSPEQFEDMAIGVVQLLIRGLQKH
ncbi:MAG: TetR/AcrR family transcriptional regulator [Gammaproteobacteria bacterium]|nr:TetR/AcrR family transcriptional regulator [Gammaproteobacteria bacterium]